MKVYDVLSWGGGTQSTALMLMMLKQEMNLDYIIFADTKDEHSLVYEQIYKVQRYVEKTYGKEIHITSKNKILLPLDEIIELIKGGLKYRGSEYQDLWQSHILYFMGVVDSIDIMPVWTRNKVTGKVGKTPFKQCTFAYKLNQLLKYLRKQIGIKSFDKNKHHINMYIGYSYDEFSRFKPNPKSYATNFSPLIDRRITKSQCVKYVEEELGFIPRSSVCNSCFANDFYRAYDIYKTDSKGWERVLHMDYVMANKPKTHKLKDDCFQYRFQAIENIRLYEIDMEEWKLTYDKLKDTGQLSLFEEEQEWGCNGGCFL